jgi:cation diffusion facilitator CzcD-associated flavoprotein CzcO
MTSSSTDRVDFPVAILGAGFAGIGAAIKLQEAGIESFEIFERAGEIGGTWRDNTYPGAACDVPSHLYSFSFAPKPDWTQLFSTAGEIQEYLLDLVDGHDLRRRLHLDTAIVGADFDETSATWTLRSADGRTFRARAVIAGLGGLVDPAVPDIAGLADFGGRIIHTARWDHDYDLAGKRVAVIGTGASAIQVVPAIAARVARMTVFQRTAAWILPKMDHRYSERARRRLARHPWLARALRWLIFAITEYRGLYVFPDSPRLKRRMERWSLAHLAASVRDPALREKLTPKFQFGCKRVLISDDFWSTFERDNVALETTSIERVTADAVVCTDGTRHEVDAIIMATGFALGLASAPFPIHGLAGRSLDEEWKHGAVAYKGVAVAGFPNWFIIMGPNTGPGHTSVLVYTEAQIHCIVEAVRRLRDESLAWMTVRRDVQERYNERLQRRLARTVWASGCNSWYLGADGSNHALFPGFATEYVARVWRLRPRDWEFVPTKKI